MPRLSKTERAKIISDLMNDEEDSDDELLLQPMLRCSPTVGRDDDNNDDDMVPSQASTTASSPDSRPSTPQDKEDSKELSESVVLKRARARAQLLLDSSELVLRDIRHPEALRWHREKKQFWPCFIHENLAGLALNGCRITKQKDTIVSYLGLKHKYVGMYAAVSSKQLLEPLEQDGTKWSSKEMQSYLHAIRDEKVFRGQEGAVLFQTEAMFLQLLLERLHTMSSEKAIADEKQAQEEAQVERDNSNAERERPPVWNSPGRDNPTGNVENDAEPIHGLLENPHQYRTLRAGDVIKYFDPVMKNAIRQATIQEVHPRQEICLSLSDGMHLHREAQIKLEARLVRGQLVPHKDGTFLDGSDFILDSKRNGKVTVKETGMRAAIRDIVAGQEQDVADAWKAAAQETAALNNPSSVSCAAREMPKETVDSTALAKSASVAGRPPRPAPAPPQAAGLKENRPNQSAVDLPTGTVRPTKKRRTSLESTEPSTKPTSDEQHPWLTHLQELLAKNAQLQKRKRFNLEQAQADQRMLETAIRVRQALQKQASLVPDQSVEDLVVELARACQVSVDTLWSYLTGNTKNLLQISVLNELTTKCQAWHESRV